MRLSILTLLLCLALAAWAKSDHLIPGLPVYPAYPDEHAEYIKSGSLNLSLSLNGAVQQDMGGGARREFTGHMAAQEKVTLSPNGGKRTYDMHGTGKIVIIGGDGKRIASTYTHDGGNSEAVPEMRPGQGPLGPVAVCDKLKCCAAYLSGIYPGDDWQVDDITGKVTMEIEGVSETNPFPAHFSAHLPCVGRTNNVLSTTMNAWEGSGKNGDGLPMGGACYVECPWTKGGCSGSITVAVEALCSGAEYQINTVAASRAQYPDDVRKAAKMLFIPGSLTLAWSLNVQPKAQKMTITPQDAGAYDKWVPLPKFEQPADTPPIALCAEMKAEQDGDPSPAGRIDFYLRNVSRHKGECGNFPRNRGEKSDLRFTDAQPDGIKIDPDGQHAWTDKPVSKAIVLLVAEDGGAYGSVQAVCDDLHLIAEDPTGRVMLHMPKDENDNHIADAWEKDKGVYDDNLPSEWDEPQVAGQTVNGDGLPLYDKYRGLRVAEGDTWVYKRFPPKRKCFFVLDDNHVFNSALWTHAADINAYVVTDGLVQGGGDPASSRLVDYCADNGHKYCVRIEVMKGLIEKDPPPNANGEADTQYAYTDQQGDTPKTAERLRIFPDRIGAMLDRVVASIRLGVADPKSEDGQRLHDVAGITDADANAALAQWNPATRAALVKQMVAISAIHECGHACGLAGHCNAEKNEDENIAGDPACPMQYLNQATRRQFIVKTILSGGLQKPLPLSYDHFCKTGNFKCFSGLNVKDE